MFKYLRTIWLSLNKLNCNKNIYNKRLNYQLVTWMLSRPMEIGPETMNFSKFLPSQQS